MASKVGTVKLKSTQPAGLNPAPPIITRDEGSQLPGSLITGSTSVDFVRLTTV
jgi:hypothetical protein